MRDYMKYVVVEYRGCELPIMFDPILGHNEVTTPGTVLSAGEVVINCNKVCCWGKSLSLGVKSREDVDAELIDKLIN